MGITSTGIRFQAHIRAQKKKILYQKIAQIQKLVQLAICDTAEQNDVFMFIFTQGLEAIYRTHI